MTARPCLDCGTLTTSGSRCPRCQAQRARARDARRGSARQRGYDQAHDAERARWSTAVDTGAVTCARCGQRILPGTAWDLDHTDDRSGYLGPSHARCNRATAGRDGRNADDQLAPATPTVTTPDHDLLEGTTGRTRLPAQVSVTHPSRRPDASRPEG